MDGSISWLLHDHTFEPHGRELLVSVEFEWEEFVPGDWTTPAAGGLARIVDVAVAKVGYYDELGQVQRIDHAPQGLDDLAWELLKPLRTQVEEVCASAAVDGLGEERLEDLFGVLESQRILSPGVRSRQSDAENQRIG